MNKNEPVNRMTSLSACTLAITLLFATTAASAQSPSEKSKEVSDNAVTAVKVPDVGKSNVATSPPVAASAFQTSINQNSGSSLESQNGEQIAESEDEEFGAPSLQVGDATLNLLAWQRSGKIASGTPRPIAGNVAGRSYERYLKSFEYPIPERFGSSVKTGSGGNAK